MVWGRDSETLYVADADAVWRATLGAPFMPVWHKIHVVANTRALTISPSGEYLVVEAGLEEDRVVATGLEDDRHIYELRLGVDNVEPRTVASGWSPMFLPHEDVYFFGNYKGYHMAPVGADPRPLSWVGWTPDGP